MNKLRIWPSFSCD